VKMPERASWQDLPDVPGEDRSWFGVVCSLEEMPEDIRIELREEELVLLTDWDEYQELELRGMTDQAIADAMARLLVPLIEQKRGGEQ
jgi:hypothetical protein